MRTVWLLLICIPWVFGCNVAKKNTTNTAILLEVKISQIDTNKNIATAIVIDGSPKDKDSSFSLAKGKTIQITKMQGQKVKLQVGKTYTARLRRDGTFNPYGYMPVDANSFVAADSKQ